MKNLLKRLDIDAQLDSIKDLLKTIGTHHVSKENNTSVIRVCLKNVHMCMTEIRHLLKQLKKVVEEHNKKWYV